MKAYSMIGLALLLTALACALCACGSNNRSVDSLGAPVVTLAVPAGMAGGAAADWTVTWKGGKAPFTVEINLGAGVADGVHLGTAAASPYTRAFTMLNDSRAESNAYQYSVRVTDAFGASGAASGGYVVGTYANHAPLMGQLTWDAESWTLGVAASDGDPGESELSVRVTPPAGAWAFGDQPGHYAAPDWPAKRLISASGSQPAEFAFFNADLAIAASGMVAIEVEDGFGGSATAEFTLHLPRWELAPDTLYAMPAQRTVKVGEPVVVVIATGVPAHPFQFMNGVGLVVPKDADELRYAFDHGALGGSRGDADGFWAAMDPSGGFLLPPDMFRAPTDIGGGLERWDYNVTPVGGRDMTTAGGALFNVVFTFATPGVKVFGFQEFNSVRRTFYSDSEANHHYWGDITNDHAGYPNSVEVVE